MSWRFWLSISLIWISFMLVGALARDVGQFNNVDPSIRNWVRGLSNKNHVNCCAMADGYPAEAENDTSGGHWRVKLEGQWVDVPDEALIDDQPNRLGYPMVWWYPSRDMNGNVKPVIRCFIPGALL